MSNRKHYGIANGLAKLTPAIVTEMRQRHLPRCRLNGTAALAKEFGVAYYTAWCAIHRQTWPQVRS